MFNMRSRYQYRSARRLQNKSKRNFLINVIIIIALLYTTFFWILPSLINGLGFIKNFTNPSQKIVTEDPITLAPPVFNIPYEATNTAQIEIPGYATPNSKVELFLDDGEKGTIEVGDDGSFIFRDINLNFGTNNIYGKTVDEKGIESLPSKTLIIIFDNEKPPLDVSEPEDGKKVQGERKIKFAGKTEIGAKVYINGNQIIVDKDGNFSSDQSLNDGDNNYTVRASDSALNFSELSRMINFTP